MREKARPGTTREGEGTTEQGFTLYPWGVRLGATREGEGTAGQGSMLYRMAEWQTHKMRANKVQ